MYIAPQRAKPLDLRPVYLKIDRARKHIADLDGERVKFLGINPYSGVARFNPETKITEYVLESLPDIPDCIPLILGDAIHNLRVSLDYLACELVRSVGERTKGVYFPICESLEKYEAESRGKTKGMPDEAKKVIDGMKPYGRNSTLWTLHDLEIIDKHRLLPT